MDEQNTPTLMHTPNSTRPEAAQDEGVDQLTLFARLLALGCLITAWQRIVSDGGGVAVAFQVFTIAIAFLVLVKPAAALPVVLLGAMQLVYGCVQMPMVSSADVSWMFFGGTLSLTFAWIGVRERSRRVSASELLRHSAPCLRLGTLLVIIMTAVARWNWAFLRISSNPALDAYRDELPGGAVGNGIAYVAVSALLCVDVALVAALLIPSLRRFAVGFGGCWLGLQAVLGIGEAAGLLPVLLVGLLLFTSMELSQRILGRLRRQLSWASLRSALVPAGVAILLVPSGILQANPQLAPAVTSQHLMDALFVAYVVLWQLLLLAHLVDARPKLVWVSFAVRQPPHYAWLALLVMVTLTPYLGWGTTGRFVDGSGLDTLGETNNHLWMPTANLLSQHNQAVEVVSASDPHLQQLAEQSQHTTWFELVNYLNDHPQTSLRFVLAGEQFDVPRAADIEETSTKNPWILRKLVSYAPVRRTRAQLAHVAAH